MSGIYLRCDKCGATLSGEDVVPGGLHWSQCPKLQEAARERGWTGPLTRESDSDLCPECTEDQCQNSKA
jgi:hypothetical protein